MRILALLLCFSSYTILISQSTVDFGRLNENTRTPPSSISNLRKSVISKIPSEYNGTVSERAILRYAHESSLNLYELFDNGFLYSQWNELSDYLNSVLDILKSTGDIKDSENIKVYVLKDGSVNAFMTPSGAIIVTLGLLSEIEDESGLAGVLAHELAHFIFNHNIDRYIRSVKGEFKPKLFTGYKKAYGSYSIKNELDADAFASEIITKAGYSIKGVASNFELTRRAEIKRLLLDSYSYEIEATTHPSSNERLESIMSDGPKLVKKYGLGKKYIVNEAMFNQLKNECKVEVLRILLREYKFRDCFELAFKYHLYDPYNSTYVYYIMESIRRMCSLDATLWKDDFFVDRYYEFLGGIGKGQKVKVKGSLFDSYRYEILGLENDSYEDLVANFYWEGESKFSTYEEAFQFFFEIGKLLEEPECYLSNALSLSFDNDQMVPWLNKYLSYKNVKYRDYAEYLINNDDSTFKDSVYIYSNFLNVVKQNSDYLVLRNTIEDTALSKSIKKSVGKGSFIILDSLKQKDLVSFFKFRELEKFSLNNFVTRGNKLNIFELDPDFWYIFNIYEASTFIFLNMIYEDTEKGKYTTANYLKVADSNIDYYLSQREKKKRRISFIISSLAINENSHSKKQYYDTDVDLINDEIGYDQVERLLNKAINEFHANE